MWPISLHFLSSSRVPQQHPVQSATQLNFKKRIKGHHQLVLKSPLNVYRTKEVFLWKPTKDSMKWAPNWFNVSILLKNTSQCIFFNTAPKEKSSVYWSKRFKFSNISQLCQSIDLLQFTEFPDLNRAWYLSMNFILNKALVSKLQWNYSCASNQAHAWVFRRASAPAPLLSVISFH